MEPKKMGFKKIWQDHKLWIIPGALLLCAGIGYAIYKRKSGAGEDYAQPYGTSTRSGFRCQSKSYPLKHGTCHRDVAILQSYLIKAGHKLGQTGKNKNGVDGQFGDKTLSAAKALFNQDSFDLKFIQSLKAKLK